jgi:FkbM family methyltransferase
MPPTFAQCGQDRLAEHLLMRHYTGRNDRIDDGHYVDVGAYHPRRLSNTAYFYDLGWRGICIDPGVDCPATFAAERPEDVFISGVVSKHAGRQLVHLGVSPSHNTIKTDAEGRPNRRVKGQVEVDSFPLSAILEEHAADWERVDLLSVDVEGVALEVLESADLGRWQPTLAIIEFVSRDVSRVFSNPIHELMKGFGYELAAWTPLDCFYLLESRRLLLNPERRRS